jgi:hypothetical protein
MEKSSLAFLLFVSFITQISFSQKTELLGKVKSPLEVENIHVINKTAQIFTTTNVYGEFRITASLNDTIVFSSIQHKLLSIIVDQKIVTDRTLVVALEEQLNALDEVIVGKVLSGDILADIGDVYGEPMTAKKAGIPSYQGPLKTQSERKLIEATTGGGIIPLNPIINAITGRTKELKNQVKLEEKETLMYSIKARLSENLFEMNSLDQEYIMEYFYFVSEQDDFLSWCKNKSDIHILEYLNENLTAFKNQLKSTKN